MKNTKDRVIAIDYFRGVCILMVVLNHAVAFSLPFAFLGGVGGLWTSAAEIFFLLSGITLGIVRGPKIISNFRAVLKKTWLRALHIYGLNVLIVFISLGLGALLITGGLSNITLGNLPHESFLTVFFQVLSLKYGYGLATYLAFYSVYMIIAPFALYALWKKYWIAVPALSTAIFLTSTFTNILPGSLAFTNLWQLYFFWGMTLARFRVPLIRWFFSLPRKSLVITSNVIVATGAAVLLISILADFGNQIYPYVSRLTNDGWLPVKLRSAYIHLLNFRPELFAWFRDSRLGYLRPMATLLLFLSAYILYQKYKEPILRLTGDFVNTMGRNTLWVFLGQAIVIPVLAAFPIPRNIIFNFALTVLLLSFMWMITQRHEVYAVLCSYKNRSLNALTKALYIFQFQPEEE